MADAPLLRVLSLGAGVQSHIVALSYGGGVQTVTLAILAAQGKIARPDVIAFADTGREPQAQYDYNERMRLWLAPFGLTITALQPDPGESLSDALTEGKPVLPFYGDQGGQLPRVCTERWKIRLVRRHLRSMGAETADVMLGISVDEIHRARDSDVLWARNVHPLLDLRMTRADCGKLIRSVGLPVPEKWGCDVCPHRSAAGWARMRRDDPAAFQRAAAVEASFPGLYLHAARTPLPVVADAADGQGAMFDEDGCTGGYCFV